MHAELFGSIQIHMLFQLPVKNILNFYRLAELTINGLLRKPEHIQVLKTMNVIFFDEIG